MKIKGYASYEAKKELKSFEYTSGNIGQYEVLVKITHCGICHSDIHLIDNDWMISSYPFIPGHEIIGEVVETGSSVEHISPGMRVGIGWQSGSCNVCEWCTSGQENLCIKPVATCVGRNGGFADYVISDSRFTFSIPEKLSSENAGPLLCGGITVFSPLKNYGVKPYQKVGVIGIGGLGHLAIQFANAMGCEVTAFSSSGNKETEAKSFGATNFISSTDPEALKRAVNTLDFIISTVNVKLDWKSYVNILRPNGKLCFVGVTPDTLDVPTGAFVLGQKSVCGSVIGGRASIREMLDFAARHNIVAQTELFPLNEVNKALDKIRNNTIRYRAVLKI